MTVWITGASSGIGRALAAEYCSKGWKVVVSSRNISALEDLRREMWERYPDSPKLEIVGLDYRKHADFPATVERVFEILADQSGLDLVILNAGISQRSLFRETEHSVLRDILSVDLEAPMLLTKALLPRLIRQGGGRIAAMGSLAGYIAAPIRSAYAAAKHGLHGFFKTLAVEERKNGIRISIIVPGFVKSDISLHALSGDGSPWNRRESEIHGGQNAEAAARRIAKGISRGRLFIHTGYNVELRTARLLGRYFPALFARVIQSRLP